MSDASTSCSKGTRSAVGGPAALLSKSILLLGAVSAATGVAQAQSAPAATSSGAPVDDKSLSWHGLTVYGVVDVGIETQSHGAPLNDYFPAGGSVIVQPNSNHPVTGLVPNSLSQSRIGLQGNEPIVGDWSGVFKLETFFNPQSGQITDATKSLAQNNGRSAASGTQTTNLDSSIDGQTFQQSFAGFSSKTYGTITFGRQNTILADGIAKYDPNFASQAFSLIGLSGTTAGGGSTEERRLDDSVKYVVNIDGFGHFGALYKFNQATGGANNAFQAVIGGEYAGFSIDAYYSKIHDAIAVNALTAAQVGDLAGLGLSDSNTLRATVSDNTSWAVLALYDLGVVKFYAGFEHIQFADPRDPFTTGINVAAYDIPLSFLNQAAYPTDREQQVYWAGVRYTVVPDLDLVGAYYAYHQNSYGIGANAGCDSNQAATCSGRTEAISFDAVYRLSRRFDTYLGALYTGVLNGQANGYVLHTTDITTTWGVRFKF